MRVQLQFEKQELSCLHTVKREIQNQEQTQELRISDGMPDIGRIIGAWGQVILRGKEWQGDGMTVTGGTKGCICSNAGPIRTPADLAGLTIRSTGTMAKAITAFGGVPSDIAIADCYESIRQGVKKVFIIDGRVSHSILIETLTDEGIGTMFFKRGDCEVTE